LKKVIQVKVITKSSKNQVKMLGNQKYLVYLTIVPEKK